MQSSSRMSVFGRSLQGKLSFFIPSLELESPGLEYQGDYELQEPEVGLEEDKKF